MILLFVMFSFISIGHAQTSNQLISNNVVPKYNAQLSGSYPTLKGSQFKKIDDSILKFITVNFDGKDDVYPTELSFKKLFQNNEILSFSIDYNISNSTERYFNKYYTLDLLKKKELNLYEYLEYKKIPKSDIFDSINLFISPCLSAEKSQPEYCSDMTLQSLLENNTKVNYSDVSGFFIKNNNYIRIGFDSNKLTTTFIYNIKTKKISLN